MTIEVPVETTEVPIDANGGRVRRSDRWRWVGAAVLVALTMLGAIGSVLAVWANTRLLDTDEWVEMVRPLGSDPEVTEVLGERLADRVILLLDPAPRLAEALPEDLGFLAIPLANQIEQWVDSRVRDFVQGDTFSELWIELNRTTHQAAVRLLRGGGDAVQVEDGVVTLDLVYLINAVLDHVLSGLSEQFGIEADIPDLEPGAAPQAVREALETALGRSVPEDLTQVEVFRSDTLELLQAAVRRLERLQYSLPVVTALVAAGAVLVAPARRRLMVAVVAGAAALGWALSLLVIQLLASLVLDQVADGEVKEAVGVVLDGVTGTLDALLVGMILLGIIVIVSALGWPAARRWWEGRRAAQPG